MNRRLLLTLALFISVLPAFTDAKESGFIQWHSTNIQVLRGFDYELGSEKRTIMTFEHANGWKYGDFYLFADQMWQDGGESSYYVEPTLRFSLSKILGKSLSYGIIKDLLISGQIEKPEGQNE